MSDSAFLHPLQHLVLSQFFILDILYIVIVANDVEHLFMWPFGL